MVACRSFSAVVLFVVAATLLAARPASAGPVLLYDHSDGRVLYADEPDRPWFPASLTKLMTAYLVFEAWRNGEVSPDQKLVISKRANALPKMRLGLGAGKEITYAEAVDALILKSANDIALAVAEALGGSEGAFVARMNMTADRLGMTTTRYVNPHGLPGEGQYTTARDLARLTESLVREFPEHLGVFSLRESQVGSKHIATHNSVLVNVAGGDGMKTGFTCPAGYNIVASATREGRRIVAIVLGEESKAKRARRTADLIEYGFAISEWKRLLGAPTLATLAAESFEREAVWQENIDKRIEACRDPEPPPGELIAAADGTATAAVPGHTPGPGAAITTGSVTKPGQAKAPAASQGAKQAAKTAKRPSLAKRPVRRDDSEQKIKLATP